MKAEVTLSPMQQVALLKVLLEALETPGRPDVVLVIDADNVPEGVDGLGNLLVLIKGAKSARPQVTS